MDFGSIDMSFISVHSFYTVFNVFGPNLSFPHYTLALAGKFKQDKKMCIWCEKSKKNLGSIGGSLKEPQPKHIHWCLTQ